MTSGGIGPSKTRVPSRGWRAATARPPWRNWTCWNRMCLSLQLSEEVGSWLDSPAGFPVSDQGGCAGRVNGDEVHDAFERDRHGLVGPPVLHRLLDRVDRRGLPDLGLERGAQSPSNSPRPSSVGVERPAQPRWRGLRLVDMVDITAVVELRAPRVCLDPGHGHWGRHRAPSLGGSATVPAAVRGKQACAPCHPGCAGRSARSPTSRSEAGRTRGRSASAEAL